MLFVRLSEVEAHVKFIPSLVCHFDEGEISTRSSTKIGELHCGVTREDFSFVEMTRL